MAEVTIAALSEAGALTFGDGYRTKRSEHGRPGYRILRVADVADGRVDLDGPDFVSDEYQRAIGSKLSQAGDVLLTTKGTVGRVAIFPADVEQVVYSPQLCFFRVTDPSTIHPRFLAYWFKSEAFVRQASHRANNTDMAAYINLGDIASLSLDLPGSSEQQAIAEVLGALDDKIAANAEAIRLQSELADALFSRAVSNGADQVRLGDVAEFHNRRRVPLSSRERQGRSGNVPYYGAASRMGLVDQALFDEPLLLVGEDGTVVRGDGEPVTQYIWGPAWVNNHAHVLTGSGVSTELLRGAVRRSNVAHLITGAVQPKLSMGNLRTLELTLPLQRADVERDLQAFAGFERATVEESRRLAIARDELLPLLMSGKVRVKDAEKTVEGVL